MHRFKRIVIFVVLLAGALIAGCQSNSLSTGQPDEESKAETSQTRDSSDVDYTIVGTGQKDCYDDAGQITCPKPGEPFFGQNAEFPGVGFSYEDNEDGTVTDLNTGLMWQKSPDLTNKSTYDEAVAGAEEFGLANHDDWRLPTIKELYSLIDFNGSGRSQTPYIDTDFFDFRFGDEGQGERAIDGQYWSSTEYVGTTMNGDATVFGVNFADGRIKGYPRDRGPGGTPNTQFVRYVRGNPDYGKNDFTDNGDGTVTDKATGLTWQKADDGQTRNWEEALANAENLKLAGHDDWRLPNAKELQSIVDYDQAPDAARAAQRGPAIDSNFFETTEDESYFWTNTTLLEAPPQDGPGSQAIYFAFGQAFGFMGGSADRTNVHGAGSQRSDPKSGDPADFEGGRGPQGDEVRIDNYVRVVRGGSSDN